MPALHQLDVRLECYPDGCCLLSIHASNFFGGMVLNEKIPASTPAAQIVGKLALRIRDLHSPAVDPWMRYGPLFGDDLRPE